MASQVEIEPRNSGFRCYTTRPVKEQISRTVHLWSRHLPLSYFSFVTSDKLPTSMILYQLNLSVYAYAKPKAQISCTADQRLCFCFSDSTIPLLFKSQITIFYHFSVTVQAGLCQTWSEIPKNGFLMTRAICIN